MQTTSGSTELKLALTRQEAARALGISATTVDRLARQGVLRPLRATRRPLYAVAELERFLAQEGRAS